MHDKVAGLLVEASQELILPRFRRLVSGDIAEKSPGELVTAVDRDVEVFLTERLRALSPGSLVIGEEACSGDPTLLSRLDSDGDVWLVDPLDGTANFVAGSSDFGVLVALMREGRCVSSWTYLPITGALYSAELGAGAFTGGGRMQVTPERDSRLRAIIKTRFLPPEVRTRVLAGATSLELQPQQNPAAVDYAHVCSGACDTVLYWRTLPWDHAGPALLLQEAGGVVRRPDGAEYRVSERREGLLVACSEQSWQLARSALFG
jgi:fructose-1,6-bisphosphatase/inositol monophosphatase family enzyme